MPRDRPLLAGLLREAARWFDESMLAALAEAGWPGLTRAQVLLLSHVEDGGTRTAELARRMGVTRQAAHQQVRTLIRAGLVELRPDPGNRSAKLVLRTAAGRDCSGTIRAIFQALEGC